MIAAAVKIFERLKNMKRSALIDFAAAIIILGVSIFLSIPELKSELAIRAEQEKARQEEIIQEQMQQEIMQEQTQQEIMQGKTQQEGTQQEQLQQEGTQQEQLQQEGTQQEQLQQEDT